MWIKSNIIITHYLQLTVLILWLIAPKLTNINRLNDVINSLAVI